MSAVAEILVMGGVHGNEPLGSALVRSLKEDRIEGVDALIANERAVEQGVRFIDNELSCDSVPGRGSYEDTRFSEVVEEAEPYSLILDIHNVEEPGTFEAWMYEPTDRLKNPVRWLMQKAGVHHALKTPEDWALYNLLQQTVTLEIGMPAENYDEWEKAQIKKWRSILKEMAEIGLDNLRPESWNSTAYMYLESAGSVDRAQAKQAGIEQSPILQRYDRIPDDIAQALQLEPGLRAQTWNYNNMSKPIPGVNGEREYWGSYSRDIAAFL